MRQVPPQVCHEGRDRAAQHRLRRNRKCCGQHHHIPRKVSALRYRHARGKEGLDQICALGYLPPATRYAFACSQPARTCSGSPTTYADLSPEARVKVHFDAISAHFPHDSELPITQADELTDDSLAAAAPAPVPSSTSLPISPAASFSIPASPIPSSLGRIPSNAGSSSAHGSSGDSSAIKEEGESDTPSSRTARLLADVRAGKLESHEVLAALKITPTRDSDRRPSDTSIDRLKESASALRAEETARNGSVSSLDPQLVQFPSPRPSVSSNNNFDLYKAKVKVGPRPSNSTDSNTGSHVATLPAGVSLPKPATPAQSPKEGKGAIISRTKQVGRLAVRPSWEQQSSSALTSSRGQTALISYQVAIENPGFPQPLVVNPDCSPSCGVQHACALRRLL